MQSFTKSYGLVFEIVSGADDFSRYVFWVTATRGPSPSWQRIEWKKNSRPPRECRGALLWQRAYVVEGHASACPRTVGVDASMWRWRYRCVVELLVVCKVVSTDGMFGVKEKETSLIISGLARKPRKRRIKVKIRPWCVSFSGYILISPEREMECTQLFCALGWIIQCQN